jgi:cation transport regulator ChaC
MNRPYLEVTFRDGRPMAAYFYLPRKPRQRVHRSVPTQPGLVIDFARNGQPIGIEITAPTKLSVAALNRVLRRLGQSTVSRDDLAPLRAA